MVMMSSNEDTLRLVHCGFHILSKCLDHFPVDPAIALIKATKHQLVKLCHSICAEERGQDLDPLMESRYFTTYFIASLAFFTSLYFPCWQKIDAVLLHLRQGVTPAGPHVVDTSYTSADESEASHQKVWGADEVGRFFVTGATDATGRPSHFYCRICRKEFSVSTHGPHEVLGHFQGVKHFARDQRLRLETPGWRVLDFEGNPFNESELERQRKRILRSPLVIPDREYPFAEDLIVDDSRAPDATSPVLAKVSSLIEVLRLGAPTS